jgi:hypothetical protein
MPSPGNARIAGIKTVLGISDAIADFRFGILDLFWRFRIYKMNGF